MNELNLREYVLKDNDSLLIKNNSTIYVEEESDLSSSIVVESNNIEVLFVLKPYSKLNLSLFVLGKDTNVNIVFKLDKSSYLTLVTADSMSGNSTTNKTVELNGENSETKIYEFSSTHSTHTENGVFKMVHNAKNTTSNGRFVYLSNGESSLNKNIISHINKDMINSNSSESIKGVILGEKSKIDAKPILVIDCDDVHASHGCAIGTLDDNEVYYLMSRGLSRAEAIKTICSSLIVPILKASKSDEYTSFIKPYLEKAIEV